MLDLRENSMARGLDTPYLVKARGQEDDLNGADGELSGLITIVLLLLGAGPSGESTDAWSMSVLAQHVAQLHNGVAYRSHRLGGGLHAAPGSWGRFHRQGQPEQAPEGGHPVPVSAFARPRLPRCTAANLVADTNLGAYVIEEELAARGAADVDSAGELDGLRLVGLAVLEVGELLGKVPDVVGDLKLQCGAGLDDEVLAVGGKGGGASSSNLVRVGLALGVEVIDSSGADLKVLHIFPCQNCPVA